jgi:hypothetical protein
MNITCGVSLKRLLTVSVRIEDNGIRLSVL